MPIATINPTAVKTESTFDPLTDEEIGTALARSAGAAKTWATTSVKERADLTAFLHLACALICARKLPPL